MISRELLIGGVLAATDKLTQEAGQGDWSSVAKTAEQRRMLLDALMRGEPQSGEHEFLNALRAAVSESETALAVMNPTRNGLSQSDPTVQPSGKSTLCMKA